MGLAGNLLAEAIVVVVLHGFGRDDGIGVDSLGAAAVNITVIYGAAGEAGNGVGIQGLLPNALCGFSVQQPGHFAGGKSLGGLALHLGASHFGLRPDCVYVITAVNKIIVITVGNCNVSCGIVQNITYNTTDT